MIRTTTALATLLALGTALPAAAQQSSEMSQMRAQLQSMQARLDAMEAAQASRPAPAGGGRLTFGNAATASLEVYGYAKADFISDLDAPLGLTTLGLADLVPGEDYDGQFEATAYQSRLGFNLTAPTAYGDLVTQIETDFYGGGGGELRLRHANATLGNFRVGRYWTTFMPLFAYPVTVDFQGVAGIPFQRRTMLRYTFEPTSALDVEVAIEDAPFSTDVPALIGAVSYETDPATFRASAVLAQIDAREDFGLDENEGVYGVNLAVHATPFAGMTIDAAYTFSEGINSYMVFGNDDLRLDATGGLERVRGNSAYIGVAQEVSDKLTLGAIVGYESYDSAFGAPDATDNIRSLHVNAFYDLLENTTLGLEYFRGTREVVSGGDITADRIQASVQVSF